VCTRNVRERKKEGECNAQRIIHTRQRFLLLLLLLLLEIPIGMAIANCLNEVRKERNCSNNNNK